MLLWILGCMCLFKLLFLFLDIHPGVKFLGHMVNLFLVSWEISMGKAMAPHSSTVARKIPWMEEPGRLQSMGLLRVRHDWATSLSFSTFMHWRRKWQPTPVFLPGESQGRRSPVGCSPWGRTESNMTEATWQQRNLHTVFHNDCTNLHSHLLSTLLIPNV